MAKLFEFDEDGNFNLRWLRLILYLIVFQNINSDFTISEKTRNLKRSHGDTYSLLPFAKEAGLSGIEAITPKPQDDVTLK